MTGRWNPRALLARNEAWLSFVVATASTIFFSIYTGVLSASVTPGADLITRIQDLGWINWLFALGLFFALAQVALIILRRSTVKTQLRSQGNVLCHALLDSTLRLLRQRRPHVTYRGLITVLDDRDGSSRVTVCAVNSRTDPDLRLAVPRDFGIGGRAFNTKSMQISDLNDENRSKNVDGSQVEGIWPDVRCVLAFPMLSETGEAFGAVVFDCDYTSVDSGLADRKMQGILGTVAELATFLMRAYGREGTAQLPR